MTLKQLKHFIEQSEILIGINSVMISRCIKNENIPVDDIKAVLEDNNNWLSFYLNCLKGAAKEKNTLK